MGFAKPLTFAAGAEYRHEQFKIRPGDTPSYAAGRCSARRSRPPRRTAPPKAAVHTAATGFCSFPGREAPVGAQGFPGIPANSRDQRQTP